MGGFGSGRRGGRLTVDDGLTLDVNWLSRHNLLPQTGRVYQTLHWSDVTAGERIATISYQAEIGGDRGVVRLIYTSTVRATGDTTKSDYQIVLTSIPLPFGGRRWFFLCPRLGIRCSKLHLPDGETTFASRRAHQLDYPSQRETARDRALRAAFKARQRLGDEGPVGDFTPKPKWMRWRTYARLMTKVDGAEAAVNAHAADLLATLERRDKRAKA